MAAALPPVRTPKSGRSQMTPQSGSGKSRPATSMSIKSFKLKNANRKEQEIILRREALRDAQPTLNKAETAM